MMMARALTLLNLHQVICIEIHTLRCLQPCLVQTGPHQAIQTLIGPTRPSLAFPTYLGWICLLTTKK